MRCDGSPDPTVPGEINTYINLRLEDKENNDIMVFNFVYFPVVAVYEM